MAVLGTGHRDGLDRIQQDGYDWCTIWLSLKTKLAEPAHGGKIALLRGRFKNCKCSMRPHSKKLAFRGAISTFWGHVVREMCSSASVGIMLWDSIQQW